MPVLRFSNGRDPSSEQTVFLAFYRNPFLHSLLPLEETSRYIGNAILVLCLGVSSACFSFRLRQGRKGIAVIALAAVTVAEFSREMGSLGGDALRSVIAVIIAASAVAGIRIDRDMARIGEARSNES